MKKVSIIQKISSPVFHISTLVFVKQVKIKEVLASRRVICALRNIYLISSGLYIKHSITTYSYNQELSSYLKYIFANYNKMRLNN